MNTYLKKLPALRKTSNLPAHLSATLAECGRTIHECIPNAGLQLKKGEIQATADIQTDSENFREIVQKARSASVHCFLVSDTRGLRASHVGKGGHIDILVAILIAGALATVAESQPIVDGLCHKAAKQILECRLPEGFGKLGGSLTAQHQQALQSWFRLWIEGKIGSLDWEWIKGGLADSYHPDHLRSLSSGGAAASAVIRGLARVSKDRHAVVLHKIGSTAKNGPSPITNLDKRYNNVLKMIHKAKGLVPIKDRLIHQKIEDLILLLQEQARIERQGHGERKKTGISAPPRR